MSSASDCDRIPLTADQVQPFYRKYIRPPPTHAQLVLRNERKILDDVRRQLIADPKSAERDQLLEACRREHDEVVRALAVLMVEK